MTAEDGTGRPPGICYFRVVGLEKWNDASRELSANVRLRILYARDSGIFLVLNERQTDALGRRQSRRRDLIFKVTYRLYL